MEKFFGRHKFRVSVRRKLESLGSDFLGFLVVRTGRIVVFPRKKCMLLCHFMLLICLPPSKLQFSSQLTRRCASSIERTGDLLPMKMHLFSLSSRNQCRICLLFSELTICFHWKKNGFLKYLNCPNFWSINSTNRGDYVELLAMWAAKAVHNWWQ